MLLSNQTIDKSNRYINLKNIKTILQKPDYSLLSITLESGVVFLLENIAEKQKKKRTIMARFFFYFRILYFFLFLAYNNRFNVPNFLHIFSYSPVA